MTWRTFNPPGPEGFSGLTLQEQEYARARYLDACRCGLCHEPLQPGDEFAMRAVSNSPGLTQLAVLLHRRCLPDDDQGGS